jgi:hypothetical protein
MNPINCPKDCDEVCCAQEIEPYYVDRRAYMKCRRDYSFRRFRFTDFLTLLLRLMQFDPLTPLKGGF